MHNGFPCSGKCGCFTSRTVDNPDAEKGGEVFLCIWCEDELPCPSGKQLDTEVRRLEQAPRILKIKVRKPVPENLKSEDDSMARTNHESIPAELLARAVELAKSNTKPGIIAKELNVEPWRVYSSIAIKQIRDERQPETLPKENKMKGPKPKAARRAKACAVPVQPDVDISLVPVYLNEEALNRIWKGSSLIERAQMITDYMAKVHA